jgi:predicted Zn-dependent peptidase
MYQRTVLPNGLRIVTAELPHVRSASVSFFVGAGSRYEHDEQAGVSHFLEHMLFKGTERRPTPREIAEEIEGAGGTMNAVTDKELTVYYAKVGADRFQRALDVLADNLLHSTFQPEEIEKERQVILEELAMTEDSPGELAGLLFDETLWPDQPLGRDSGGSPRTVRQISRDAMMAYHRRQYAPANTVLAVAGRVGHAEVVEAAGRLLTDWQPSDYDAWEPAQERTETARVRIRTKRTEQAHLDLGLPAYGAEHPDRFALDVLATVLGDGMSSRLFVELRENRALTYDVCASVARYAETGAAVVSASLDPPRTFEALGLIVEQLLKMREPIPEAELMRAKEYMKGRLQLRMDDSGAVASWLGRQELLRGRIMTVDEVVNAIESVSLEDVQRVAEDLLRPERLRLAVVGPFRSTAKLEAALK